MRSPAKKRIRVRFFMKTFIRLESILSWASSEQVHIESSVIRTNRTAFGVWICKPVPILEQKCLKLTHQKGVAKHAYNVISVTGRGLKNGAKLFVTPANEPAPG